MTDRVYELLARPGIIGKKIRQVDIQIEALNMSMIPAGMSYDKAKVQSSPQDPMAEYAARIDDLYRKRDDLCKQYLASQDDVTEKISEMDDETEKTILMARYIGREDFTSIADGINMSERNMFRIYHKALLHIDKVVSECQ